MERKPTRKLLLKSFREVAELNRTRARRLSQTSPLLLLWSEFTPVRGIPWSLLTLAVYISRPPAPLSRLIPLLARATPSPASPLFLLRAIGVLFSDATRNLHLHVLILGVAGRVGLLSSPRSSPASASSLSLRRA